QARSWHDVAGTPRPRARVGGAALRFIRPFKEAQRTPNMIDRIREILGDAHAPLLEHECRTIPKERLHLPGPDFVDRVMTASDRPVAVNRNYQHLLNAGRLGGTGYVSILPVDQGVEHSAAASFAPSTA